MSLAERSGLAGAVRDEAIVAVLTRAREAGLAQVRIAWPDLHGTMRGKTLMLDAEGAALRAAFDEGIGLVSTMFLKDTSDRTAFKVFEPGALAALQGFGAANNTLLLPDPASFQILPWAPHTGWLRAEPFWPDGSPVLADPRRVLQRALADLAEAGLGLRCGLEVEFHIHRITQADDAAADAAWPAEPPAVALIHPGYQLLGEAWADRADEPLQIVRRTALALGLPLRSLEIELGPSQVEAVFGVTDALTAADHMLLFRNATRQALRRVGYHVSFVCKPPLPSAIASGWHLHQSLVDAAGRNAMQPETAAGEATEARHWLAPTGVHWLAGLLEHAEGLTALSAPTIPAYARYQGSVMAPQARCWGTDNRGAMLRVLGGVGDAATRIENRLAEPMANPHLLIAGQIAAGLDGLQRGLQPGPASATPYGAAQAPLPTSLPAALDALRASAVLQRALGPVMATVYDTVKRQEIARQVAAVDPAAWERREYFSRY